MDPDGGTQLIAHATESIAKAAPAIEHAASLSKSAALAFEEQVELSDVQEQTDHRFQPERTHTISGTIAGADIRHQLQHRAMYMMLTHESS